MEVLKKIVLFLFATALLIFGNKAAFGKIWKADDNKKQNESPFQRIKAGETINDQSQSPQQSITIEKEEPETATGTDW